MIINQPFFIVTIFKIFHSEECADILHIFD